MTEFPFLEEEGLLHLLNRNVSQLREAKAPDLFGFETKLEDTLDESFPESVYPLAEHLPLLDPSFLGYSVEISIAFKRDKKRKLVLEVPAFAVYGMTSPIAEIGVQFARGRTDYTFTPPVSPFIQKELTFEDEAAVLRALRRTGLFKGKTPQLELRSCFLGRLQESTRKRVRETRELFAENELYVVAREAWIACVAGTLSSEERNEAVDNGLIIGVKDNYCFLIEDFTTDLFVKAQLQRK